MQEPTAPQPNQTTATENTPHVKEKRKDKNCDQCLKGGLPLEKELLSFLVLLLIALTTLMSVLWINEKRKVGSSMIAERKEAVVGEMMEYPMPRVKAIQEVINLPQPKVASDVSVEETLASRRSRRSFAEEPVSLAEVSQVLWAAQGITDEKGHRAAPSAKSAYPYTLYVVVRNVAGLDAGLYQYMPQQHQLGDLGVANAGDLLTAAGVQEGAQQAPVVIVLSAAYAKMQQVFPDNDPHKNTYLEGGHIGQNIYLQVEGLGMSTVVMGGFDSQTVGQALQLDEVEDVVYLIPLGHRTAEVAEE